MNHVPTCPHLDCAVRHETWHVPGLCRARAGAQNLQTVLSQHSPAETTNRLDHRGFNPTLLMQRRAEATRCAGCAQHRVTNGAIQSLQTLRRNDAWHAHCRLLLATRWCWRLRPM